MRLLHVSLGGCFTAPPIPFGLTEDTGGHIAYVLGAAMAQAEWPGTEAVDIATRLFDDPDLGAAFAQPREVLGPRLRILRIATANRCYLSKSALAADVEAFAEALIVRMRREGLHYDLVHAHFADAGVVAQRLRAAFGIPFLFHAHSLALDKPGNCPALRARFAAEDAAIGAADGIIASSRDEVLRQLPAYPSARPARILRAPPGIDRHAGPLDLGRAEALLAPFLRQPGRPLIVTVARPVARKNLAGLIDIYAASPVLRAHADLVILAGLRDDIADAEPEQAEVFAGLLAAIDRHDLYGHVALPKRHRREDVFALYRLAARSGGVFAQPAFCEPYGLTIAEAAAEGLPVVATNQGGARDIVEELGCGLVADPNDHAAFASAIAALLLDPTLRGTKARQGRKAADARSWQAWAAPVMALAARLGNARPRSEHLMGHRGTMLTCDLDDTLTGNGPAALRFARWRERHPNIVFAIATGRSFSAALRVLAEWALPEPDILITGAGAEIAHRVGSGRYAPDLGWADWAGQGWQPEAVAEVLDTVPGLIRQPRHEQRPLKRAWFCDAAAAEGARARLRSSGLHARLVHSHGRHLDVLPARAGKGAAMAWCADALGIRPGRCVAAGDSGNDADLLTAAARAILVANHDADLAHLRHAGHIHLCRAAHADGVLEGMRRFAREPLADAA